MKNTITIFLLLVSFNLFAQKFQGKAIYKTSRKSSFKLGEGKNSTMSDDMKKQIQARIQKMNQKTYILNFNNYASSYKEDIKLDAPKPKVGGSRVMVMSFGGSGSGSVYYKNTKEKRFVNQTEIMGKRFLVKDSLEIQDWKLSSEIKNIGNYTCYKATYSREVERIEMTLKDGKPDEVVKKETIVTTAWYTPQVPVSNGPSVYQGLPGLILEINDGKTTIVCTEIILDRSGEVKIEEPQKGKVVNQEEYQKISREKSKEMMNQFRSRDGKGIEIKIGG